MFDFKNFYEKEIIFNREQIEWHRKELEWIKADMKKALEARKEWIKEGSRPAGYISFQEKKLKRERAKHYRWISYYKERIEKDTKKLETLQ